MLRQIQEFFNRQIAPSLEAGRRQDDGSLRLAAAALLVEMMRMDRQIDDAERDSVIATLVGEFGVARGEIDELLSLAEAEAREATDYYQFTSLINRHGDAAAKVRIVESLWRVAYADGHLDAHEAHLMRKIADLLHVPHADYVAAKARARDAGTAG